MVFSITTSTFSCENFSPLWQPATQQMAPLIFKKEFFYNPLIWSNVSYSCCLLFMDFVPYINCFTFTVPLFENFKLSNSIFNSIKLKQVTLFTKKTEAHFSNAYKNKQNSCLYKETLPRWSWDNLLISTEQWTHMFAKLATSQQLNIEDINWK